MLDLGRCEERGVGRDGDENRVKGASVMQDGRTCGAYCGSSSVLQSTNVAALRSTRYNGVCMLLLLHINLLKRFRTNPLVLLTKSVPRVVSDPG